MTTALSSVVALSQSRQARMTEELLHALGLIPRDQLRQWGTESGVLFGKITWRRAKNFGKFFGRFFQGTVDEVSGAYDAHKQGILRVHALGRAKTAKESIVSTSADITTSVKALQHAVTSDPKRNAPALVVSTLAFLAASGGADGDGGVPDLDLVAGIDAHRSIFTHSILSGAAIETFLMASASFVGIAHSYLPKTHDPIWDAMAAHKDQFVRATSQGVSLGIAYHLFIDSAIEPGAYHDLPGTHSIETHQAVAAANAVAEGIDVKHKTPKRHA